MTTPPTNLAPDETPSWMTEVLVLSSDAGILFDEYSHIELLDILRRAYAGQYAELKRLREVEEVSSELIFAVLADMICTMKAGKPLAPLTTEIERLQNKLLNLIADSPTAQAYDASLRRDDTSQKQP